MIQKVTISEKGQIVIPNVLRKRYGLQKGDKLSVEEVDGAIVLRPLATHPILSLRGKYKNVGQEKLTDTLLSERKLERERDGFE
jgi:AbrB family looped-hinge helix DNA binding protein